MKNIENFKKNAELFSAKQKATFIGGRNVIHLTYSGDGSMDNIHICDDSVDLGDMGVLEMRKDNDRVSKEMVNKENVKF